jgi:hypothetical protein
MVTAHSHDHAHPHHHGHSQAHGHGPHSHGLAAPHPAQAVTWSILRMTVLARFAAAAAVSAALWAFVWLSMR